MVGLSVIRQATADDFEAVFNLVWPQIDKLAIGTPCVGTTASHLWSLIDGDGVIFVNSDLTAAGAAWMSDGMLTKEKLCTGLWLVSEAPRQGLKVARALIEYARSEGAIPACSARGELAKFYQRLGMKPRETVYVG